MRPPDVALKCRVALAAAVCSCAMLIIAQLGDVAWAQEDGEAPAFGVDGYHMDSEGIHLDFTATTTQRIAAVLRETDCAGRNVPGTLLELAATSTRISFGMPPSSGDYGICVFRGRGGGPEWTLLINYDPAPSPPRTAHLQARGQTPAPKPPAAAPRVGTITASYSTSTNQLSVSVQGTSSDSGGTIQFRYRLNTCGVNGSTHLETFTGFTFFVSRTYDVTLSSGTYCFIVTSTNGTNRTVFFEVQRNQAPTGLPTITGTERRGHVLMADTSGIADADGLTTASFSYQWLREDSEIATATSAEYTLQVADVEMAISVTVSFTDDGGTAESLTSAETGEIAAAFVLSPSAEYRMGDLDVDVSVAGAGASVPLHVGYADGGCSLTVTDPSALTGWHSLGTLPSNSFPRTFDVGMLSAGTRCLFVGDSGSTLAYAAATWTVASPTPTPPPTPIATSGVSREEIPPLTVPGYGEIGGVFTNRAGRMLSYGLVGWTLLSLACAVMAALVWKSPLLTAAFLIGPQVAGILIDDEMATRLPLIILIVVEGLGIWSFARFAQR